MLGELNSHSERQRKELTTLIHTLFSKRILFLVYGYKYWLLRVEHTIKYLIVKLI